MSASRRAAAALVVTGLVTGACVSGPEPVRVGALYPLSGTQGPGGVDEYRGVLLAADLANRDGGVSGRPIEVEGIDAPGSDAVPAAMAAFEEYGIDLVLGSYGSTLSRPAADAAARRGMLFWETGAVGEMSGAGAGDLVFRVSPTGAVLGRSAIAFVVEQLAPLLDRDPLTLRYAAANVDDVYGSAVARGAVEELQDRGLPFAGQFSYDLITADYADLVRRMREARTDVLFVSAYLEDGIALRQETVRQGLEMVASIGTSSSYCMPEFGARLGPDAVGLYASDKPSAHALHPGGLTPEAAALLDRAATAYLDRHGEEMSAPALAGFSAAWALFREVLPNADSLRPADVGRAALAVDLPAGSLPNGSGLRFGPPGEADAGANLLAATVIWEWIGPGEQAIVWPPAFATAPIDPIAITP